jgi:RHS repeat-associated protein
MTTTKKYDHLNRLLDISSVPSAASPVKFSYSYNEANQRIRRTDSDESHWAYEYDFLGQVTSGKHYWPDATPVAGQQFEYAYDDIGNRRRTKEGGDASGAGLRTAHYTVNNLNQYTQRDVPGGADIIGIAYPYAPVTVNDQPTYRRGEYYHKELAIDNSSAPVWQSVTNQASYTTETNTTIGNLLLPKTPQTFWYDEDGNMLSDFVCTNSWDGENRMAATENTTAVSTAGRAKETWTFDDEGRWIQRIVSAWNGSTYAPQQTNRFLWDGKLLAAILDHGSSRVMSFIRGIDITGSFQRGGGAGGLAAVNNVTNGVHFCAYDGNGNVSAPVSAETGLFSGAYQFDPFGNLVRLTGSAASANPIRFSTQLADDTRNTSKYLYRDFQSALGRWTTRDPIEERGARNLYAFALNQPVSQIDLLGLSCCLCIDVSMLPPSSTPTGIFIPGTPTSRILVGIHVPYTITVLGNGCVCELADSGSVGWSVSPPPPPPNPGSGTRNFGGPNDTHTIACANGADHPGLDMTAPASGSVGYSLDYNLTITVTCFSTTPFVPPKSASTTVSGSHSGNFTWP